MTDIPVQSVRKAFALFSILVFDDLQREGIALTTLAKQLDLRTNTTHNILKSMCATGFVAQTAAARYIVGPKCLQIGRINRLLNDTTLQWCRPPLEALSAKLNETVLFVTLVNGKRNIL